MMYQGRNFSKDELWLAAKVKGWIGERRKTQVEVFAAFLREKMVTSSEIREINKRALSGGATPGETQVIEKIVERGLKLEPDVEAFIRQEMSKLNPHKIILDGKDAKPVSLKEHTHPVFEKTLRLARGGVNVLLVGPAGCGKTYLAEQLAKALRRRFGALHCTAGASESQLLGWLLPVGAGGTFKYVPAEFVALFEEGDAVFLLDELDAADPNMLLVINGATAGGSLHVPQRHQAPHVKRGKNVSIIAAANTFGTGADMLYAGRNQLDAATLDRFYVVHMDYDKALEREIAGDEEGLLNWVWALRDKIAEHRLRRVASIRMLQKAIQAKRAGIDEADVKRELLAGWTRDELLKTGVSS